MITLRGMNRTFKIYVIWQKNRRMYQIQKSRLFKLHSAQFVSDYKERAGTQVANAFIDCLSQGIRFIAKNPQACPVYTHIAGHEYRKWRVKDFPHSIYFRLHDDTIILEAIYAHRMDILSRLSSGID